MKTKTNQSLLTFIVIAVLSLALGRGWAAAAVEADPAYLPIEQALDLKSLKPEVNVNLPRFLLKDAVAEMNGGTNDPLAGTGLNLADLVKDVKLIRVVVIDAKKNDEAQLAKGVAKLKEILEHDWTPVVSVPEANVGVYALGDPSGESLGGLAVLVHDGGDAVIANIVGKVSLGKIIKIASQFDKLPKDLLQKLSAAGGEKPAKKEDAAKKP